MMTLKEILRARKGASAPTITTQQSGTDNHAKVTEQPSSSIKLPIDEFYAIFEGCTDF